MPRHRTARHWHRHVSQDARVLRGGVTYAVPAQDDEGTYAHGETSTDVAVADERLATTVGGEQVVLGTAKRAVRQTGMGVGSSLISFVCLRVRPMGASYVQMSKRNRIDHLSKVVKRITTGGDGGANLPPPHRKAYETASFACISHWADDDAEGPPPAAPHRKSYGADAVNADPWARGEQETFEGFGI